MSHEGLPPDFEPRTRPRWKRTASFFAILFVGILSMKVVASGGGRPESSTEEPEAQMVEIATLESGDVQAVVESTGVLTSAETIALMTEVSGRVAWVSKNLRIGGRFERGEALFRVEDVQYKALLAQQQVRLHQAWINHAKVHVTRPTSTNK